ncbi:chymotrypsin-1-like [Plodia interpunctella]|uniref:chymotrypsin-1-like n=1 Tax=Plodia interpunctella TaxID=58824 RepID=UPI002367867A|nr:chymotrypsin-1-like [Plodia interpunctella]
MVVKVVLLLVALAGCFAIPAPEPDQSSFFEHVNHEARIVGGSQALEGGHPHMVALSSGVLVRSFLCGGSLITSRSVLTAAHCIEAVFSWGALSTSLRGTVGTNRWNQGGASYAFERNVTHQNYVSSTIKNDIGLLITTSNVLLSSTVNVLPLNFNQVGGGVVARAAGWGRIRQGGALSTQLLQLDVSTLDGETCVRDVAQAAIDFNIRNVPPVEPHIEICTTHSVNHGMCNGDSGSALVHQDQGGQIGIVSWGIPCARGAPDMFVRVSAYQTWILANATLLDLQRKLHTINL